MKQTIIVTGASRGIGKAIALACAQKDINILINCRKNKAQLMQVQAEIIKKGANCQIFVGDLGDFSQVEAMFALAHQTFGPVDVLINNAGISVVGLFQDTTPAQWNAVMESNVNSVYHCSHLAVKDMLAMHQGKIINISSVWGICGASCEVAYCASKGAINAMTKALAKELAPSNIQVNAIACGAIDTTMNGHLSEEELSALTEEIPAGRLGQPEDVAELVCSLLSGNAYLTGQIIQLDGGWI